MVCKEVGFLGLGRMGFNMAVRTLKNGIRVVGWNRSPGPVKRIEASGGEGSRSVKELVSRLWGERKVVWLMLPAGDVTEKVFQEVLSLLGKGDIIIDGANSCFRDSLRRHKEAEDRGVGMLDVGVSGGIVAAERGYSLMIGGKKEFFEYCRPLFEALSVEEGFGLVGGPGAGHYAKMVHNAIEYGMMQAIGEGFELLEKGSFKGGIDMRKVARIWNRGSVVSSFLMEMAERALEKNSRLSNIEAYVEDSGEGRWAVKEAVDHGIPFSANSYALNARFLSRDRDSFAFRMLAALRKEFGGHTVREK